ncbi:hypothetical protein Pcinc_040088, partial [Petrolisthes cinctipes]
DEAILDSPRKFYYYLFFDVILRILIVWTYVRISAQPRRT